MISSHRLYRAISFLLEHEIKGAYFSHAISFDKDSLLIHFIKNKQQLAYEIKFLEGELSLNATHWTDIKSKLKSNAVVQFKELENQQVISVEFGLLDRLVRIQFQLGYYLVLKGFGKFGNVLLFSENQHNPVQLFRLNYKKDWDLNLAGIPAIWIKSGMKKEDFPYFQNPEQWDNKIKSLPSTALLSIKSDFFESSLEMQHSFLLEFTNPMNHELIWEDETKNITWKHTISSPYGSVQAFIDHFQAILRQYYRWFFVEREREALMELSQKQWKQCSNRVATYKQRISVIETQRSFKEIGDLILSNAHSIRKGTSEALITDFFTGQRIRLKINPDLSAAENAEKCYRKAKNQFLELENLKQQLENSTRDLKLWDEIREKLESASSNKDYKAIRKLIPEINNKDSKTSDLTSKPYKRIMVDSFEVWVGKNAKSNEAILKDAHKNDIWLHAADVTGSHVVIRTQGRPLNKSTLEKVASICAYHSKGKSQTLQTVMYAERKFVSKSKNAALGEVKVSKFSTIDVAPKNLS